MAEEMHKDRKKAFELQEKLDKSKKHIKTKAKEGKKLKKGSMSGPLEADGVIQEVQVNVATNILTYKHTLAYSEIHS